MSFRKSRWGCCIWYIFERWETPITIHNLRDNNWNCLSLEGKVRVNLIGCFFAIRLQHTTSEFRQFAPWPRKIAIGSGNTFMAVPGRVILLPKDFFCFIPYREKVNPSGKRFGHSSFLTRTSHLKHLISNQIFFIHLISVSRKLLFRWF